MENKPNFLKRTWSFFKQPSAKYSVLAIVGVTLVAGLIFQSGFGTAMDATNRLEFCIGCHEMNDTVFQEYKKTIHYQNRTGVRAACPDCHVPKDFAHKTIRKIQASKEIWSKLMGWVSTPEKFEARRMVLATNEWNRMKATGSQECRNCHNFDNMSGTIQKPTVYSKHMKAKTDGQTCIECHQGIAHRLPKEYVDPNEM
ncbi:MAG: NapC/NirT family cytochrome c [Sideroxydans sp.]|nr:NapC/NirT family cytochrome c [Sideroxydans sp.]